MKYGITTVDFTVCENDGKHACLLETLKIYNYCQNSSVLLEVGASVFFSGNLCGSAPLTYAVPVRLSVCVFAGDT